MIRQGRRTAAGQLRAGVTLVDVARVAGVDQSTVSRVLRSDPGANVSDATRARIREAATRLGYVPNATARGLAMRRTSTIGLLVPNAMSLVFAGIIRGAADAALELGYVLVLADASELGRASDAVRRLVLEGRVDGLLIASGTITDKITDDLIEGFHNCVVLNRRIGSRVPSVIEDDELGMYLCTQELIDHGHTEIACLAGPEDIDTSRRRLAGYRRAMREAGLPVRRGSVVHEAFDEAGGFRGMTRILEQRSSATAVASASLVSAIGAVAAAQERGIDIPGRLSVIAFHDAPIANYLSPPLTTVSMPLAQVGSEAVHMLHRRLRGEPGPQHVTVHEPAPS